MLTNIGRIDIYFVEIQQLDFRTIFSKFLKYHSAQDIPEGLCFKVK